jgi:hypothetical protein
MSKRQHVKSYAEYKIVHMVIRSNTPELFHEGFVRPNPKFRQLIRVDFLHS